MVTIKIMKLFCTNPDDTLISNGEGWKANFFHLPSKATSCLKWNEVLKFQIHTSRENLYWNNKQKEKEWKKQCRIYLARNSPDLQESQHKTENNESRMRDKKEKKGEKVPPLSQRIQTTVTSHHDIQPYPQTQAKENGRYSPCSAALSSSLESWVSLVLSSSLSRRSLLAVFSLGLSLVKKREGVNVKHQLLLLQRSNCYCLNLGFYLYPPCTWKIWIFSLISDRNLSQREM